MAIPKTRRFCCYCDKVMKFEYNRVVGHSECCVCGFRFGIKEEFLCDGQKKNEGGV